MVRTLCRELLAELCRPGATTTSSDEGGDLKVFVELDSAKYRGLNNHPYYLGGSLL